MTDIVLLPDAGLHPAPARLRVLAGAMALAGAAALAAVWVMQEWGYAPCELCLKERVPFYVGVPLAATLALGTPWLPRLVVRLIFIALAFCFGCGAVLGAYHAGVELHLWAGPSGCSGITSSPPNVGDFLRQLDAIVPVRCDQAAMRVAGMSLAGWNAMLSAGLTAIATMGWYYSTECRLPRLWR